MWNFKIKKIAILFFLCFLFLTISLFAQNDKIAWNNGDIQDVIITPDEDVVWAFEIQDDKIAWNDGNIQDVIITPDEDVVWTYEIHEKKEESVEIIEEKKWLRRIQDRKFEIGLFNFGLGFSNNFMTTSEIFREKLEIDINNLSDSFNVNANFAFSPVYVSYNKDNIWGFGLTTGLDLIGIIDLSGNMLTFNEAEATKSDIGAAVFSEIKIHSFFTFLKFKFKVKPAMYYPILYAKPNNFSYTFKNKKNTDGIDETFFNLGLDMQVYTAFPMDDDFDITDIIDKIDKITARPGLDISIGVEYPLSEALDLIKKYDFLDFDVGVDFINIPVYPSYMEDYMRTIMNIGSDQPIDFFNGMFGEDSEEIDMDNFYNYEFKDYGKEKRNVFRPFKVLISANWRPFDKPSLADSDEPLKIKREWLTFIPTIGFAINPLYFQPVSFEGGIKTRLNIVNFFIATLGIGYHDRFWKNSLDFALNFRIMEIDFGINMQSTRFSKSWTGGGFGAVFGLKFGW
jgi:hypothetical protein